MDGRSKVINFINEVRNQEVQMMQENALKFSIGYKRTVLRKEKGIALETCYEKIFSDLYMESLPLSDEYKNAYGSDLKSDFKTFMKDYYHGKSFTEIVTESVKSGNSIMDRLSKNVERFVDKEFMAKEAKLDDIVSTDLAMIFNEDENNDINEISDKMEFKDISKVVKNNVKNTIKGELNATKKQKEDTKAFEDSLVKDNNVKTESSLMSAIMKSGRREFMESGRVYQPSLFESILIAKQKEPVKNISVKNPLKECGLVMETASVGEDDVMTEDGNEIENVNEKESIMVESVKTFTALNILKALRMESFTPNKTKLIAAKYARM